MKEYSAKRRQTYPAHRQKMTNVNKLLTAIGPLSIMNRKHNIDIHERMCSFEDNHQKYGF